MKHENLILLAVAGAALFFIAKKARGTTSTSGTAADLRNDAGPYANGAGKVLELPTLNAQGVGSVMGSMPINGLF